MTGPPAREDDAGMVCACGLSMSLNPHPDAGDPGMLGVEVGHTFVCIPCTVKSRHAWAGRARRAEGVLLALLDLKDGPRDSTYNREKPKVWDVARDVIQQARHSGRGGA